MLILKQIGLDTFLDSISDGTMIKYSKPHLEIFIRAADMLKINYKRCLVVEDSIEGCIASKSTSMNIASISSAYGCQFADFHLNAFKDLMEILNKNK